MGRGPTPPDWLIDAEIVLYRDSGWSYESIGSYFGMSVRTVERRYKRMKAQKEKEASNIGEQE